MVKRKRKEKEKEKEGNLQMDGIWSLFLFTHINMYACRVVVICGWLLKFLSVVHIQQPATVIRTWLILL
jgi:hypothetical protein